MSAATQFEQEYFWNRVFGQWAWAAWIMLICNMVLPLSLFSQKLRRNHDVALHPLALHQPRHVVRAVRDRRAVALARVRAVAVGRLRARRGSTTRILLGSFGWFFMWFLLFIKQLPVMAIAEIKEIVPPRMRASRIRTDVDARARSR